MRREDDVFHIASLQKTVIVYMHIFVPHAIYFIMCVIFTQIGLLIKIVHLLHYLTMYVSKLPCVTHTKSNWKLIPKYADCDVRKRMSNCCESVKHTQSSNLFGDGCLLCTHRRYNLKSYSVTIC
jgi:hypothetical protein